MAEKGYFITAAPMIEMDGSSHIPTVVFYEGKNRVLIGNEAKSSADTNGQLDLLNEDFKIDLGNEDPSFGKSKRKFPTASGVSKSAGEMAGDFLDRVLRHVRNWLGDHNIADSLGIVVAEPLTMLGQEVEDTWLANYRKSIRSILLGKGFTKDQIDFMPEPFAVFQYYKYGLKHSVLTGSAKQNVLVIDFGGGSFDVCVIETDLEGEITGKRKNTRPKAAQSVPVGGFFVNKKLAEFLFYKYVPKEHKELRTKIRQGLEVYKQWRVEGRDISTFAPNLSNFARNFRKVIYDMEDPKLMLCNSISNWALDSSASSVLSVPVRLPRDAFAQNTDTFNGQLTALEFREVFRKEIWQARLKPVIEQTLQRAKEELEGAPLTVVLLSGGSCNIRWLKECLEHDFGSALSNADILALDEDFQEIVAKGLAVECARRFYDENSAGDFTSVTYNGIHLILDPDGLKHQLNKTFEPAKGNPFPATKKPGVLLPSASMLRNHFDEPLTWLIRPDRPPKRFLDYYFLRSGFDPYGQGVVADGSGVDPTPLYSDDLLNLEQHRVRTPSNCSFDSKGIHLQLTINKESKTASPKFIYRMGDSHREQIIVEGGPFYLDATDTQDNPSSKAYVGLDFGTSNTALSFVNQTAVTTFQKRSSEKSWLELKDLSSALPYPLAVPLARHLCEIEQSRMIATGREFLEAALAMAAYLSYLEMCVRKGRRQTRRLGGFTHRSIGPLWGLVRECMQELGNDAVITRHYKELLSQEFYSEIDQMVTFLGQLGHQKGGAFNPRVIRIVANISQKIFREYRFGYFENVQPERFKAGEYKGLLRTACGRNTNFVESNEYKGAVPFGSKEAFVVDVESREALPLQPFIFWYRCAHHPDEEHCYFYDKPTTRDQFEPFSFKAAGFDCSFEFSSTHDELGPVAERLISYLKSDPQLAVVQY